MAKDLLTQKEIAFVENGNKWNIRFEVAFLVLWVASVIIPFFLMTCLKLPVLEKVFDEEGFYSSALLLGLLVTIINQRWIRIVRKLME
jgi:hypothetical protein